MDAGLFIYFHRNPGHNIYFKVFDDHAIYFTLHHIFMDSSDTLPTRTLLLDNVAYARPFYKG